MIWKKSQSNLIVVTLLTIAYTIIAVLLTIGPLHINSTGGMNAVSVSLVFIFMYWVAAVVVSWGLYLMMRNKPEHLFFTLIILGIVIMITEVFIWG